MLAPNLTRHSARSFIFLSNINTLSPIELICRLNSRARKTNHIKWLSIRDKRVPTSAAVQRWLSRMGA